jgi:hypothetical protein
MVHEYTPKKHDIFGVSKEKSVLASKKTTFSELIPKKRDIFGVEGD